MNYTKNHLIRKIFDDKKSQLMIIIYSSIVIAVTGQASTAS